MLQDQEKMDSIEGETALNAESPSKIKNMVTLRVTDATGTRLDRWLKRQYPHMQQGMIEKSLRQGKIRVQSLKVTAGFRLTDGDAVSVPESLLTLEETRPQLLKEKQPFIASDADIAEVETWILWEDADLLVLNKPHGLAMQGGTKTMRHLDGLLQALGQKNHCTYRLVHRLDRDTSGVCVVAKNVQTAGRLSEAFKERTHEKIYWAIVMDFAHPAQGTIDAPLTKTMGEREKVVVDPKYGKPARTRYRTLKKLPSRRGPQFTWLELCPETGRTHQLRVHCQAIGHPIVGDGKYGGREATVIERNLCLHARSLTVEDRDGVTMTFVAPPPPHMVALLKRHKIEWQQV